MLWEKEKYKQQGYAYRGVKCHEYRRRCNVLKTSHSDRNIAQPNQTQWRLRGIGVITTASSGRRWNVGKYYNKMKFDEVFIVFLSFASKDK